MYRGLLMNKKYSDHVVIFALALLFWIAWPCFYATPAWVWADDIPLNTESKTETDKIHITSNSLVTDSEANFAEFIGDVVAKQGDTVITGDKLKIFYKNIADGGSEGVEAGGSSVEKMVARGNVTIRMDNRLGEADKAEYFRDTGVIILTGKNAKISSGNNTVSGNKITIYRETNNMTVEHDGDKRVEAFLFSNDL